MPNLHPWKGVTRRAAVFQDIFSPTTFLAACAIMKSFPLVLTSALGVVIIGSAFWLESRWYAVIDVVQTITVLNSRDDLFVFIEHDEAVLTDTRFRLLAKQVTSVPNIPEHVSDDLLVVRMKDGKLSKYDLKGFGSGGSSFVHHGDVYWSRGRERGDTGPTKWKWDGSKFPSLPEAEAALVDYNHLKNVDESTKNEGWNQASFKIGDREAEVTIRLRNENVKVYGESENGTSPRERVFLVRSVNTNAPEILIDIVKGYREISKEQYFKLREHQ